MARASHDDGELEAARTRARPLGARLLGLALIALLVAVLGYVGVRLAAIALRPAPAAVGSVAPPLDVVDLDGRPVSLAALEGQVVVLDFWATWCSGCVAFHPAAERIARDYEGQGLTWLSLHVEPGTAEEARAFLAARGSKQRVAMVGEAVTNAYGIHQTPSYVLLDRAGKIDTIYASMASEPQLRKRIDHLLSKAR